MTAKLKIESGFQLLARLTKKPSLDNFYSPLFKNGPSSGDIIELFSDTCTSHLITDIISEALLCKKSEEMKSEILVFDTDGNLNYDQLLNLLKRKILIQMNKCGLAPDPIEVNKQVQEILSRFHFLRIYDATQFYTSIYNLENILVKHPGISLIIFDTLTAFYWSEQSNKITKMDLYTKSLIKIIQNVTKDHKTICLYSRPLYFCTNKEMECLHQDIAYQIQLQKNDDNNYQVNIGTVNSNYTNFYKFSDGHINWIT